MTVGGDERFDGFYKPIIQIVAMRLRVPPRRPAPSQTLSVLGCVRRDDRTTDHHDQTVQTPSSSSIVVKWWKSHNKTGSVVDMNAAEPPKSKMRQFVSLLLGVIAFVIICIVLENEAGLPFEITYRVGCAVACLTLIYQWSLEHPEERWLRVGFWFALLVNVGLFFTPIVDRPASRGELMIFALPDTVVVLAVGLAYYPADDVRQRAVRQQMILGLVVAGLFCATVFGFALIEPHTVG